jgi:hypothetical protein
LTDWLFQTVEKRVLTRKAKLTLALLLGLIFGALWLSRDMLLETFVGAYLVAESPEAPPPCAHLVVENWTGDIETFLFAKGFAEQTGARLIAATVYSSVYSNARQRQAMMLNAWAAELDTSRLVFFIVPFEEPKTLNLAKAVIDSVSGRGWREFGLVTQDLHSARSKKCYDQFAKPKGIAVHLLLYERDFNRKNWFRSLTGWTVAFPELIKRLYYDMFIL